MIYNNYNVVQNIYERRAAGERAARFCVRRSRARRNMKMKKRTKKQKNEKKKKGKPKKQGKGIR